jgi:hypothetical protein
VLCVVLISRASLEDRWLIRYDIRLFVLLEFEPVLFLRSLLTLMIKRVSDTVGLESKNKREPTSAVIQVQFIYKGSAVQAGLESKTLCASRVTHYHNIRVKN